MLRLLRQVVKLPVVSQQAGHPIATVRSYVIDPEKGIVVAYTVQHSGTRYLSTVDVLRYFDDAIVISDAEVLQPIDELIRVKRFVDGGIKLLGCKVITEEGVRLGSVDDCLIDTTTHHIAKLYVQPTLLARIVTERRIIPREHVMQITPKAVVVRYDMKTPTPEAGTEVA